MNGESWVLRLALVKDIFEIDFVFGYVRLRLRQGVVSMSVPITLMESSRLYEMKTQKNSLYLIPET